MFGQLGTEALSECGDGGFVADCGLVELASPPGATHSTSRRCQLSSSAPVQPVMTGTVLTEYSRHGESMNHERGRDDGVS